MRHSEGLATHEREHPGVECVVVAATPCRKLKASPPFLAIESLGRWTECIKAIAGYGTPFHK